MIPRPYQIVGRDFLLSHPRALLADQMRVGKTPQAILAADSLSAQRVLVVCPAIAVPQWVDEWARWSPGRTPAVAIKNVPPAPDFQGVAVMSYNRAVEHQKALMAPPKWDVLIVDEAHFAKSPTAQRTHAIYAKNRLGWNAARIWALSGTPAPNHAGELWPMLRAFGAVKCGYEEFVRYYCHWDERKGRIYGNKKSTLDELKRIIRPFYLRRTRAEVAPDMPEIQFSMLAVNNKGGWDLPSENPQLVAEADRITVALAKVPELVNEIEFNSRIAKNYRQTVVFGYHREPLRVLQESLVNRGIIAVELNGSTPDTERITRRERFKRGEIDVICAQMIAAGTAIDLSAASHAYFLELDWVPGNNEQAANRLVNLQTQQPVTIDVLNWPGTKDDAVQRTLLRKLKTAVFTS